MKRLYVVLIVIAILALVSSGALILIQTFWDFDKDQTDTKSEKTNEVRTEAQVGIDIKPPTVEGGFGATSSGGGSGDKDDPGIVDDGCILRQVQYSLKNFRSDTLCLENGSIGCSKMRVNCFVEVYNFDNGVDDIFKVRYSLINSGENELDFKLVQGDVAAGNSKIFSTEFVWEDEGGVDENLNCAFGMESIPNKKIC